MAGVHINGQMASAGDVVAAYVNVNGSPQLRGKETVQINDNIAGCLLQVYTETDGETVYFKVWDASTNQVYNVTETLSSQVNGVIGSWPDNLFWLNATLTSTIFLEIRAGIWFCQCSSKQYGNYGCLCQYNGEHCNDQLPDGVFIPGNPYNTLTS